jgi:hypothetical protein
MVVDDVERPRDAVDVTDIDQRAQLIVAVAQDTDAAVSGLPGVAQDRIGLVEIALQPGWIGFRILVFRTVEIGAVLAHAEHGREFLDRQQRERIDASEAR